MPPPPPLMTDFPEFNRWLLDLISFISVNGGIDPIQVPGTVINGSGPPAAGTGADGQIYIDNTGTNNTIPIGIAAEGAGIPDSSNSYLYAKIGGNWVLVG